MSSHDVPGAAQDGHQSAPQPASPSDVPGFSRAQFRRCPKKAPRRPLVEHHVCLRPHFYSHVLNAAPLQKAGILVTVFLCLLRNSPTDST
eukprot:9254793-Pyramimonas_sp.AAC.1